MKGRRVGTLPAPVAGLQTPGPRVNAGECSMAVAVTGMSPDGPGSHGWPMISNGPNG